MISWSKNKRILELAISFWIGIGLMSIINIWRVFQNHNATLYSWIMFAISIIFIIICAFLINRKKQ
jgi:hypothetical protein